MIAKRRRHALSDQQWELVAPMLPAKSTDGRPARDPREMLEGMLWIMRTGAPWRDLPERFGPWQTVYHYFNEWRREGVLEYVAERLLLELDVGGLIDWDLWCVDSTAVRASKAAAGAGKRGARKSPQTTR